MKMTRVIVKMTRVTVKITRVTVMTRLIPTTHALIDALAVPPRKTKNVFKEKE